LFSVKIFKGKHEGKHKKHGRQGRCDPSENPSEKEELEGI
jgi:hypothetical protein